MVQPVMREEQMDPYAWLEDRESRRALEWTAAQNERTRAYFERRYGADYAQRVEPGREEHFPIVQGEGERCFVICERGDGTSAAELRTQSLTLIGRIGGRVQEELRARAVDILPGPGGRQVLLTLLEPDAAFYTVAVLELPEERTVGLLRNVVCAIWEPGAPGRVLYTTYPQEGEARGLLMRFRCETGARELLMETDGPAVSSLPVWAGGGLYWKVKENFQTDRVYHLGADGVTPLAGDGPASLKPLGIRGGRHYLITSAGAPGRKVIACTAGGGEPVWETVIPEGGGSIRDGVLLADRLLLIRMEDACCFLEAYDLQGTLLEVIGGAEDCCSLSFGDSPMSYGCQSFDGDRRIYLQRESFLRAPEILLYDVRTGLEPVYAPGEPAPDTLRVRRYFVPSEDGTRVPVFVVRSLAAEAPGQPALVFSYGGYAQPVLPHSSNSTTGICVREWVEAGGIYVSCSLRGGSEYGEPWHEAGMLAKKKNVFTDLACVVRWLKRGGEIPAGRVAICGQSNGGLTVTATMAAWPDVPDCVVASVAHTDMIGFVHDARGPIYTKEYGDPTDPDMRRYLLSYSPYHNIRPERRYPPIYLQVGERDNNVPSYHSKKLAARLEESQRNTVLLRSLPNGGHDRGCGAERRLALAEMRLFLAEHLKFPALLPRCGAETKHQEWG